MQRLGVLGQRVRVLQARMVIILSQRVQIPQPAGEGGTRNNYRYFTSDYETELDRKLNRHELEL